MRSNTPKGNLTRRSKKKRMKPTKKNSARSRSVLCDVKTLEMAKISQSHLIIFVCYKHDPRAIFSAKLSKSYILLSVLYLSHDDDVAGCSSFLLPMLGGCMFMFMLTCRLKHKQPAVKLVQTALCWLVVMDQCGKSR